jgi:hypothetical protein
MLGQLYHYLHTRQTYDPIKAFRQPTTTTHQTAATCLLNQIGGLSALLAGA